MRANINLLGLLDCFHYILNPPLVFRKKKYIYLKGYHCVFSSRYRSCHQGQTWFSCSLYSFHSKHAEQKSSALEHLCWRTPEYSVLRGGVDRTVTWPVPKKKADHCLHARKYFVSLDLFRSTPKCPVLLVYVAVLAYAEYSKNC